MSTLKPENHFFYFLTIRIHYFLPVCNAPFNHSLDNRAKNAYHNLWTRTKLNELIAASRLSRNRMVAIEDLTEAELDVIQKYCRRLSEPKKKDTGIHQSHSIAAAEHSWQEKRKQSSPN